MINENSFSLINKAASDPASRNYAKTMKNKANQDSPYGKDEPSTRPEHK